MKKLISILFLLLIGCGYQPIYKKKIETIFKFNEINFIGDININRQLENQLPFEKSDFFDENLNKLFIETNYTIEETSKNAKGQVETYKSNLIVKISIKNSTDQLIKERSLKKSFSYNSKNNQSELVKYQNDIKDNLVNKIIEDILFNLNIL